MADISNNAKWFVVHTYSGYENKVASNIKTIVQNRQMEDQILQVEVPTITEIVMVPVKKKKSKEESAQPSGSTEAATEEGNNGDKEPEVKMEPKEKKILIYPSYVMVKAVCVYKKNEKDDSEELTMSDEAWYVIRNTRGVTGFVGPEGKPVPLTDDEVLSLGLEKEEEQIIRRVNFSEGDLVNIIAGSFSGFSGTVRSIDLAKKKVEVLISMFGRETPTEVGIDEVEAVTED